jgi:asparagine synthetase B (glutamine-hydrolysing)
MCGIHCHISRHAFSRLTPATKALLQHRGPDSVEEKHVKTPKGVYLSFAASVLSLRGDVLVPQPIVDLESKSILCWNGEAWLIDDEPVMGNDSLVVYDILLKASLDSENPEAMILKTFTRIRGPFACVFYDSRQQKVYFGRDCLGRRSLVTATASNGDLTIASVSCSDNRTWVEVDAAGMYVISLLDLVEPTLDRNGFDIAMHSRSYRDEGHHDLVGLNPNSNCHTIKLMLTAVTISRT